MELEFVNTTDDSNLYNFAINFHLVKNRKDFDSIKDKTKIVDKYKQFLQDKKQAEKYIEIEIGDVKSLREKNPEKSCNNESTIATYDDVNEYSDDQIFFYKEGKIIYCFTKQDIEGLVKTGKNPYTQQPIADDTLKQMEMWSENYPTDLPITSIRSALDLLSKPIEKSEQELAKEASLNKIRENLTAIDNIFVSKGMPYTSSNIVFGDPKMTTEWLARLLDSKPFKKKISAASISNLLKAKKEASTEILKHLEKHKSEAYYVYTMFKQLQSIFENNWTFEQYQRHFDEENLITGASYEITEYTLHGTDDQDVANLTAFPSEILSLVSLRKIDIQNTKITSIPDNISLLTNLLEFNMSEDKLVSIPTSLSVLTNLHDLSLHTNDLTSIPYLWNMTKLHSLNLSGNKFIVPPNINDVTKLTFINVLYLGGLKLPSLPENFGVLDAIQEIDLANNRLTTLPESFSKLTDLSELPLNGNRIALLPASLTNLEGLRVVNIDENELTQLPQNIDKLPNLRDISLAKNNFTSFPLQLLNIGNLKSINLSGNNIDSIPNNITKLENLHTVKLRNCGLTSFPEVLCSLPLSELDLANNKIKVVPTCVENMDSIEDVDLRNNLLEKIPKNSFRKSEDLREFGLSGNLVSLDVLKSQLDPGIASRATII